METNKELTILDSKGEIIEHQENAIIEVGEQTLAQYEFIAQNIDRFITAKAKIWSAILKIAKPGDWIQFGDLANIGWAGADRIATTFGVNFYNFKSWKQEGKDEKGSFYGWWTQCDASYQGRTITVFGRATSRDKFFGKAYGKMKDIWEINEGDIQTASIRNCRKEGVKVLFGVANIPVEELKKAGVIVEDTNKVEFKKKDESKIETKATENKELAKTDDKTPDTPNGIRIKIGKILLEVANNDSAQAQILLEQITEWRKEEADGSIKVIVGKKNTADLTDKQLFTILGKAKKLLESKEAKCSQ